MAHKTFISYKFLDSRYTRDNIIQSLGDDAKYYKGEVGYTPLNVSSETLEQYIKDMIFETSVTIVILSRNIRKSDWVDYEIKYSLKKITRNGIQSQPNGIVCIFTSDLLTSDGKYIDCNFVPETIMKNNKYPIYVSLDSFLSNPSSYIEAAHNRSQSEMVNDLKID